MLRPSVTRGALVAARQVATSTASIARTQCTSLSLKSKLVLLSLNKSNRLSSRCYATAAAGARKPRATKATTKRKTTVTKRKPTKKRAAPKKKKKVVVKKKKTKAKKILTPLEAKRAKVRALRAAALLDGPKLLPGNSYIAYLTENSPKGGNITDRAQQMSQSFKSLSSSERARLDQVVAQNKRKNEQIKKDWIEGFTPWDIKVANNARKQLNRITKELIPEGAKSALVAHRVQLINDERSVKQAVTPYSAFLKERWASGEFNGRPVVEANRTIVQEWKSLRPEQAQKFRDMCTQDQQRFAQEYRQVYGRSHPTAAKSA